MNTDGHIRLLPLHVANKIAAGEVVERPASVLKELMENAIDAGAERVEVTIVAGGRKLVSVRDDGCGMNREDALLAFERQATSKIRDVDDIEHISTLGFRGEAIPSIASVSRFSLVTRRHKDESATAITVNAGNMSEIKECGAPPGTLVEVRDLFCNVPARRKFLKSYATEEYHIRSVFTVNALAHPDTGFTLHIDGREVYRFPPHASLEERIHDIFGSDFTEILLPIDLAGDGHSPTVKGYISPPSCESNLRRDQFIFVNGRPATSPCIGFAIREACPRSREDARQALVMFIEVPPEDVDVNVHPAKREVRFRHQTEVRDAIIHAIADAITAVSPQSEKTVVDGDPQTFVAPFSSPSYLPRPTAPSSPIGNTVPMPIAPPAPPLAADPVPLEGQNPPMPIPIVDPSPAVSVAPPTTPRTAIWRWCRYVDQTQTGFLLLETDAGLIICDPGAARARIAYEEILAHMAASPAAQKLLIPETIRLQPIESARIRSFIDELRAAGFEIEEFGTDVWKIDAVPALAAGIPTQDLLATITADMAENGTRRGGKRWRDELIARGVSRAFAGSAVKYTRELAEKLINELTGVSNPYISPANKPVMYFISNREIARKFER